MNISDLIQPRHLERRAVIYVRQSTPNQVLNNLESQRLQYALTERASQFGWQEHDIHVVDADLGITGKTAEGRSGFQRLITEVTFLGVINFKRPLHEEHFSVGAFFKGGTADKRHSVAGLLKRGERKFLDIHVYKYVRLKHGGSWH